MIQKTLIPFILFFFLFHFSMAQTSAGFFESAGTGVSTTMATDFQSLGVNPANLGFPQDKRAFHLSIMEASFSLSSDALKREEIWQTFVSGSSDGLTQAEKTDAAMAFAGSGFLLDANINLLAFSFQNKKLGGFAFLIRERLDNQLRMNSNLAELVFLGQDASYLQSGQQTSLKEIFDGSKLAGSWYREYVLGYGRRVLKIPSLQLFVGADVKYIQGYGNMNIYSENGDFYARSAISPFFDIDYQNTSPTAMATDGLKAVGHGFGIDLGATVKLFDKLKVGMAFNDLGSITWDGNTYEAPNIQVDSIGSSGFDSYSFISELQTMIENDELLNWNGTKSYTTGLPAHMKLGASFRPVKWFEFGVDMYAPLNNHAANLDKAVFSAGGYFRMGSIAKISLGYVNGDIYHHNMPFGFCLGFAVWEMGIATGDVLTFFRQENPTLSLTTGFLRFKFGKPLS